MQDNLNPAPTSEAHHIHRSEKGVRERDLDNFLLEELDASPAFRDWFVGMLGDRFEVPPHDDVVVGKNPQREATNGQTDLRLAFVDPDGEMVGAILVESKVADGFQPEQPERYAQEVEVLLECLGDHRAAAVVVAPRANIRVADHPCFDATIRLEEIVQHLRRRLDDDLSEVNGPLGVELRRRTMARIGLLEALAGKRSYGTWTPNPVPERLGFMRQYRRFAEQIAVGFRVTASSGGRKAGTGIYSGRPIPGLPRIQLRHDFGKSQFASIALRNAGHAEAGLLASGLLPDGATTEINKKSGTLMVRLPTPPIDPTDERFDEQLAQIETGVQAILRLHEWASENATSLATLLDGR